VTGGRAASAETTLLTLLALVSFAGNSILTRMALAGAQVDAAAFTSIRLVSGAGMLALLVRMRTGRWPALRGAGRGSALALFGYAVPFTFAYLRIGAAVGALVLFGTVQLTMIGWGIAHGERPGPRVWAGLALAVIGLGALMLPAARRPDPLGLALMIAAGVSWAAYTLLGKTAADPLAANARAFLWSVPLALLLTAATAASSSVTTRGLMLAALSGSVTSALGYAIWYRALRGLSATQAAIVQLSVPVLAALAAVLLLDERLTLRLAGSAATVLAGVTLALTGQRRT
jgi:drug/metabolite transporter (DMT)-like permease